MDPVLYDVIGYFLNLGGSFLFGWFMLAAIDPFHLRDKEERLNYIVYMVFCLIIALVGFLMVTS